MLKTIALILGLAAPAAAGPYQGFLISTATGRVTENISGFVGIAGDSTTSQVYRIFLNGPAGNATFNGTGASTYSVVAATGIWMRAGVLRFPDGSVAVSTSQPRVDYLDVWMSTASPKVTYLDVWMSTASPALAQLVTWESTAAPKVAYLDAWMSTASPKVTYLDVWMSTASPKVTYLDAWMSTASPALAQLVTWESTAAPKVAYLDAWMSTSSPALAQLVTWESTAAPKVTYLDAWMSTASPKVTYLDVWMSTASPAVELKMDASTKTISEATTWSSSFTVQGADGILASTGTFAVLRSTAVGNQNYGLIVDTGAWIGKTLSADDVCSRTGAKCLSQAAVGASVPTVVSTYVYTVTDQALAANASTVCQATAAATVAGTYGIKAEVSGQILFNANAVTITCYVLVDGVRTGLIKLMGSGSTGLNFQNTDWPLNFWWQFDPGVIPAGLRSLCLNCFDNTSSGSYFNGQGEFGFHEIH